MYCSNCSAHVQRNKMKARKGDTKKLFEKYQFYFRKDKENYYAHAKLHGT